MNLNIRKSKFLCLLMAIMMLTSLMPMSVYAAVSVDSSYVTGAYTGEAVGYDNGTVTVTVTLEKNNEDNIVISDITADGSTQTPSYWSKVETLLEQIKEANGTNGVNAVSGATVSSNAVIEATESALSKAVSGFSGGIGTNEDPYTISSEAGLRYLQFQVNGGESYADKYIKLTSDIELSGEWIPVGTSKAMFAGDFDGNGHTVSGMTITDSTLGYAGLFGYLAAGASIRNLRLEKVNINMNEAAQSVYAGALAAFMKPDSTGNTISVIDNCFAEGQINISNTDKVTVAGGLVGFSNQRAAVTNCGTDVAITADSGTGRATVGGMVAWTSIKALFMNDYSLGDVKVSTECDKYDNVGAMFGQLNGIIYNCYTSGNIKLVTSAAPTPAGAFTGNLAAASYIDSCYYVGDEPAFGTQTGNSNSDTVKKMAADDMTGESFAQTLHNNLAPAAIATMSENVKKANVTDCSNLGAMTARVDDRFQDWTVSDGRVVLSGSLWTSGEIDSSIFASGSGSEEDPYIISNEAQLRAFAGSMNDKIDYTNKFIALGNNINVSSETPWTPIGGSDHLFNGTFDGAGYDISGMSLGTENKPYALSKDDLYIGLFGVLGPDSIVKNVNVKDVSFYTSYEATAYVGGIAGVMQGSTSNGVFKGATIDGCSVSGTLSLTAEKGNQFVGGIVGMQYKGSVINTSANVNASCTVNSGDLAEVGGIVGLNNRGIVANCMSDSDIYGSGSRENGNEGMAVVSNLVACNAGMLANCYASGDVTTKEHSTYAGMVSGWVTGIGKSYTCWYDLDSVMTLKAGESQPQIVKPVESIGTKVSSGVNDEGDAYTGGLVDKMTGSDASGYSALADQLNATFAAFPAEITVYGLSDDSLRKWQYDSEGKLAFSNENAKTTYVQPECEKVVQPELSLKDGIWYGRDAAKTTVIKITVSDGAVTGTEILLGASEGAAYDEALEKAQYKAKYGDFSDYEPADQSRFAGGSGTEEDPYLISNEAQLRYLSSSVNSDVDWSGKYFKQTADITLNGEWQPVGWALNGEVNGKKTAICSYPFRGNYDGGDYSIIGLTTGSKSAPADQLTSGLFGLVAGSYSGNEKPAGDEQIVRLKNIHLKNININVLTRYETYTGGLVGSAQNGVYIDKCSVTGKINTQTSESFARAGGLAASILRGAVTNSWSGVDVNAVTDTNHVYAGSLYGMDNRVTTVNCYALGDVTGNSTNNNKVHIGGLTGQSGGIHINCYASGNIVSLKTTTDVGILNGRAAGTTLEYNCYYNSEAELKQGETSVSPAAASGVVVDHVVQSNVEGRTATELKNSDIVSALNSNASDEKMKSVAELVKTALADQNSRGFVQQDYYEGNKLLQWTLTDGIAGFGTSSSGTSGSSGGSSSGSSGSGNNSGTNNSGQPTAPPSGKNGFSDVASGVYYKSAVDWAVEKNITSGKTASLFAPDEACTRAQAVTFLWRAAGSPEPVSSVNKFADVKADAYYYKAVLWAVEKGITSGTSAAMFSPEKTVSRAEMATFLWRYAETPAAAGTGSFTDVSADAYYHNAVLWAAEKGITSGTSAATFSPDGNCTRAQIVTFLYRYMN